MGVGEWIMYAGAPDEGYPWYILLYKRKSHIPLLSFSIKYTSFRPKSVTDVHIPH